jgi:ACS family phthalate transporter-like MFS transporter
MQRIGARGTISRIMILWGLVSMSMALVRSPGEFYAARIGLGAAEAGFFPGVILYLTYWFPQRVRGRVLSYFVLAIACSGVIGGPLSGWISGHMAGVMGLRSWQWLFVIEGLLPVVMGLLALRQLSNGPLEAAWLTDAERHVLLANLAKEEEAGGLPPLRAFLAALRMPRLWVATFGYFSITWAGTVLNFWSPSIIRGTGVSNLWFVGLLSAVPYLIGAAGMLVLCRSSDRMMERRWHFAGAAFLAGFAAVAIGQVSGHVVVSIVCLGLLAIGYLSATALFWTVPTAFLSSAEAAGSLALISSVGQLGSLSAPVAFGWINTRTGSLAMGSLLVAAVLTAGGCAVLSLRLRLPERAA